MGAYQAKRDCVFQFDSISHNFHRKTPQFFSFWNLPGSVCCCVFASTSGPSLKVAREAVVLSQCPGSALCDSGCCQDTSLTNLMLP